MRVDHMPPNKVVTIVEGKIPFSKTKEFEDAYASVKGPFPSGWVESRLIKNSSDPEIYRIETVWESRKVLEKYRTSTTTPVAVALFQKVGINPIVNIYEIRHSFRL